MTEIMTAADATEHLSAAQGKPNEAMNSAIEALEAGTTYNIGGRQLTFEEDVCQMLYFKDTEGKEVKIGYFTLLKRINGSFPWGDQVVEQTADQVAAATDANAANL
jgi:hypothetical protein